MSQAETMFPFLYGTMKPLRFNYSQCPVCGTRLLESNMHISEGTLCESEEKCPNGCYYYMFAYGNTDWDVNIRGHHIRFFGNYHDAPQECRDRDVAMDLILAAAQACLLEDYWELFPRLACFQCGKEPATAHFCGDRCARKGFSSPIVQSEVSNGPELSSNPA